LKIFIRIIIATVIFAAVSLLAANIVAPAPDAPTGPWYSIVPPLLAILLAFNTRRVLISLGLAILTGGLLSQIPDPFTSPATWLAGLQTAGNYALGALTDTTHLQILAFLPPMFIMVAVIQAAGGFAGLIPWLLKCIKGPKSAQAATACLGILCFIDDYTNAVVVGTLAQPITDRFRVSREKLAFLVDATSAPIAGLAVISTWIAYEVGLFSDISAQLALNKNGYAMFFDALPFRFYCILMILFLFVNIRRGREFGRMTLAEANARNAPSRNAGDKPHPANTDRRSPPPVPRHPRAFVAIVPITGLLLLHITGVWLDGDGYKLLQAGGSLFALTHWRTVISRADDTPLVLAMAAVFGLTLALVSALAARSLRLSQIPPCIGEGLKRALVPLVILPLAWSLKNCCDDLATGPFLVSVLQHRIPPFFFPPAVFVIASLISFATGTSYGTMAILIPTAIPVAHALDGGYGIITIISLGAVLDGAIFGDHCSPISDTTILSSTASACPLMDHVRTQLPYSLFVAAIALVCAYLPAALGFKSRYCLFLAAITITALFLLITRRRKSAASVPKQNHQGIG